MERWLGFEGGDELADIAQLRPLPRRVLVCDADRERDKAEDLSEASVEGAAVGRAAEGEGRMEENASISRVQEDRIAVPRRAEAR